MSSGGLKLKYSMGMYPKNATYLFTRNKTQTGDDFLLQTHLISAGNVTK